MFGFLAALGPVGMVAAVVGTVAVGVMASDSGSSSRSDDSDDLRRRAKNNEKNSIKDKIESFKLSSIKMINTRYKENITFTGVELKVTETLNSPSKIIEKHKNDLLSDNKDIQKIIKELEYAKNAV